MSKTIRRKKWTVLNPWFTSWIEETEYRQSKYGGEYGVRVKCEGKELKQRLVKYHSDHYSRCNIGNTPWSFRNIDHRRHRMRMRTALANYWKNEDYVILLPNNPRWDYWD